MAAIDTEARARATGVTGAGVSAGPVSRRVWLDEWCDELASFPSGQTYDDQVDTLSYAAKIVTGEWSPPRTQPRLGLDPHERAVSLAASSAIGGRDVDPIQVPY